MAGATGIRDIVNADMLPLVLEAYNSAVRNVFIMAIVYWGRWLLLCLFASNLRVLRERIWQLGWHNLFRYRTRKFGISCVNTQ